MIAWQTAAALWALPLAALPVVIHLLRMHRAERRPFPSLRFVLASQTAAVRVRSPSDLVLMLMRTTVVALAIVAAAGPVLVTPGRAAGWNARTTRAVVVDISESMQGPPARLADEAARAEIAASAYAQRIDARELGAGVARARAWLETAPPSQREIVVISDFQRGAMTRTEPAVAGVPDPIGLRFVQVGETTAEREIAGAPLLVFPDAARAQAIALTSDTTAVSIAAAAGPATGLRIEPAAGAERLRRVAAAAGSPAPSSVEPIVIRFAADGEPNQPLEASRPAAAWMRRTLIRLQRDPDLQAAVDRLRAVRPVASSGDPSSAAWLVVARDGAGEPLVAAAAAGAELIIDVAARSDTFFAAAVLRGALAARRASHDYAELEPAQIDASTLAGWGRQPAPAAIPTGPGAFRAVDRTDARWCWLGVLALLGLEQWLRGVARHRSGDDLKVPHAA
jgi:hypothetical protein